MSLKSEVISLLNQYGYNGQPYLGEPDEAYHWAMRKAKLAGRKDMEPASQIIAGLIIEHSRMLAEKDQKLSEIGEEIQTLRMLNRMLDDVGEELVKVKGELEDFLTSQDKDDKHPALDKIEEAVESLVATLRQFHEDYLPEPAE